MVGGALCLDFTNLVSWRDDLNPKDYLQSYEDLVYWSAHAGLLTADEEREMLKNGKRNPGEAARIFEEARDLREAIFRVFSAAATGRDASAGEVGDLNGFVSRTMGAARLEKRGARYAVGFPRGQGLDRMLAPIVWSAVQLLTGGSLGRVRECSGDTCGWLFVDASKNGSRKWCEMRDCGNRAKARRHYQRVSRDRPRRAGITRKL